MLSLYFLLFLSFTKCGSGLPATAEEQIDEVIGETRRILRGSEIFDTRPYMIYLRPTLSTGAQPAYLQPNWLCGGVIIDERYIVTSAACIEDVKHFYVVSGTHKIPVHSLSRYAITRQLYHLPCAFNIYTWLPPTETNECIRNGAMRAVWKCVPRTYRYDGDHFNNIRWMVKDIAVVMIEDKIAFNKKIKGCDFIPQKIPYNNMTKSFERPGTVGYVAGWGSTDKYTDAADIIARTSVNSPVLMETSSILIKKASCKSHWFSRYHSIIDKYMICGKSTQANQLMGECDDVHAQCRQLVFSEEEGPRGRRFETNPDKLLLDSASRVKQSEQMRKAKNTRRGGFLHPYVYGGFCENDHGGPLVVGHGRSAVVVGIISAYMTKNNTKKCFGPFLFTSVYDNRQLIQCALYKEIGHACKSLLRESATVVEEETFNWGNVPRSVLRYEDSENDAPNLRSSNNTYTNDSISDRPNIEKNDNTTDTTTT